MTISTELLTALIVFGCVMMLALIGICAMLYMISRDLKDWK